MKPHLGAHYEAPLEVHCKEPGSFTKFMGASLGSSCISAS